MRSVSMAKPSVGRGDVISYVIQLEIVLERDDAQADFRGFLRGVEKYRSAVQALCSRKARQR